MSSCARLGLLRHLAGVVLERGVLGAVLHEPHHLKRPPEKELGVIFLRDVASDPRGVACDLADQLLEARLNAAGDEPLSHDPLPLAVAPRSDAQLRELHHRVKGEEDGHGHAQHNSRDECHVVPPVPVDGAPSALPELDAEGPPVEADEQHGE